MSFQIIVREFSSPNVPADESLVQERSQIYEQVVPSLDLPKLIAAVNAKPRVYKPRAPKAAKQ